MLLLLVAIGLAAAGRVRIQDIDTLHFKPEATVVPHRGHGGPQLRCVGGATELEPLVRGASCVREAGDWACRLDADGGVIGDASVVCAPWAGDGDYVAEGSCALHYTIHPTPEAAQPEGTGCADAQSALESVCRLRAVAVVAFGSVIVGAFVLLLLWLGAPGRRSKYVYHMFCPTVKVRGAHSSCLQCYLYVQRRAEDTDPEKSYPYTPEFARTFRGTVARAPSGAYPTPKARRPMMAGDLCAGCRPPADSPPRE